MPAGIKVRCRRGLRLDPAKQCRSKLTSGSVAAMDSRTLGTESRPPCVLWARPGWMVCSLTVMDDSLCCMGTAMAWLAWAVFGRVGRALRAAGHAGLVSLKLPAPIDDSFLTRQIELFLRPPDESFLRPQPFTGLSSAAAFAWSAIECWASEQRKHCYPCGTVAPQKS